MVDHKKCTSTAPTQDGGRSSDIEVQTSLISETRRCLMSSKAKMLKDKRLSYTPDTTRLTRDGDLFMLTKPRRSQVKDMTETSDSISTDHSISDPDFQCKELLKPTVLILISEDGEETPRPSNGSSMVFQRPLSITTGKTDQLISLPTVHQPISESLLPTQDGGKCGE
jgi:hypothetical protein